MIRFEKSLENAGFGVKRVTGVKHSYGV